MMAHYSYFPNLFEENRKKFTNLTFVCPGCKKRFLFQDLSVGIVGAGYDYLCPEDGHWIMVAEDIADGRFPNILSEVLKHA